MTNKPLPPVVPVSRQVVEDERNDPGNKALREHVNNKLRESLSVSQQILDQFVWVWYLCQRCETLACSHQIQTECAACRLADGWGWPIQGQVSGS